MPDDLKLENEYARDCELWMNRLREIASASPTGESFRTNVAPDRLAVDAQNQIVVVSADRKYTTVLDCALVETYNPVKFSDWESSIDRAGLPTKFQVREGLDHAAQPELENTLKGLHARQAEEALGLTEQSNKRLSNPHFQHPGLFDIQMKNRREQSWHFEQERSRYISEHEEAKHILDEIRQNEKQQAMEQGQEKGFSK